MIFALAGTISTLLMLRYSFAELSGWSYDFSSSQINAANSFVKDEFPESFKFGVSISSYQNEGAWNVSDKEMSVWDYEVNTYPNFTMDGSTGNVATDFYHRYKEDIQLAKSIGSTIFRFSISWTRLLPTGFTNHISEDGARFYNNVINELLVNGITPMVTLFHSDIPYNIHRLGAFLNPFIIELLADYARVAFTLFGDRVKLWISINELDTMCLLQNVQPQSASCNMSGITEYECIRNSLLAHATVYHLYKRDFASTQKGKVGFSSEIIWPIPQTDSERDTQAVNNVLQWSAIGILDAVLAKEGNLPAAMRDRVNYLSYLRGYSKSRMPPFTDTEIKLIKGTLDFLGINFYNAKTVSGMSQKDVGQHQYEVDMGVINVFKLPDEHFIQETTPRALQQLFSYLKEIYDLPEIYITEAGYRTDTEVEDPGRAFYFYGFLGALLDLLKDGFDIKGFLLWTLTDNFSFMKGFLVKNGVFVIDFDDVTLPRTPKLSSKIVGSIFKEKRIKPILEVLTEEEDIVAMQEFISSRNSSCIQ